MAKQGGLGAAFWFGGNDLSGDINSLGKIACPIGQLDVTDITQMAHSRLFGLRDGAIDFVSYFDPVKAHPVLSALPTADVIGTFVPPSVALGGPAAFLTSKQINYDGTRANDGGYTFACSAIANGFGLEWGNLLTAGFRTDTAATNGTGYDTGGSLSFGGQAYLQCSAFTGTDVTVTIQDSADNSSFSNVSGLSFTQITGSTPLAQRISVANTATIRRYVRAVTTTSGGVTSVTFAVILNKNPIAGVVF